jgi:hypothetical protein
LAIHFQRNVAIILLTEHWSRMVEKSGDKEIGTAHTSVV